MPFLSARTEDTSWDGTLTPIGSVKSAEGGFGIGGQSIGPLTQRIREGLVGIQRGQAADPHGWIEELG